MKKINVIAVVGKRGELGFQNKLIWDVPEDMERFKELTMGKTVIMGRKTFESIGKPLKGRENIVITSNKHYHSTSENLKIVGSFQEALKCVEDECFVIGGGKVYKQAVPIADTIYLTRLTMTAKADCFFPKIPKHFQITGFKGHNGVSFLTYTKK